MSNSIHSIPEIVQTRRNTRIPCISRIRSLDMFYHGYNIGTLSEESNDAGEFDWVIRMNWENWEKAGSPEMPGIDVCLRLPEYIRSYVPAIVDQRTLPDTRDRLYEQLAEVGLAYNDRYEYMCRTNGLCGVNNITMKRKDDRTVR